MSAASEIAVDLCQTSDAGKIVHAVETKQAKIAVVGMGHVGLPTALGLAELGWNVIGVDSDSEKISLLQSGKAWFYEPGLTELLLRHLRTGKFQLMTHVGGAVREATVVFICVGTPQSDNGEADLSQVETVARTIAQNLNGYKLVVEKSTVPAVTAQWVKRTIERYGNLGHNNGGLVDVASNPEFLQEGVAITNVLCPDRVVCGVPSDLAKSILSAIYGSLKRPILVTDTTTAELIKHAANSFLSMKISFINMVADLCEATGADVTQVAAGIGMDPRIGTGFLQAGIGFGGYCFPKDLRAFIRLAEQYGVDFTLLKQVEAINQRRTEAFLQKVRNALWILRDKTIGVLGLSFKPGTDDIREAPSLRIVRTLLAEGATLQLHDPQAMDNFRRVLPDGERVRYCESAYAAAREAHCLLVLTEWEEYRQLDLAELKRLLQIPILIDGRNLYDPKQAQAANFEYFSVGR